jgi:hypothetical protein
MPQPAVWDIQALKRLCRTSAHLHEVKLLGKITINCLIFIMPVPTKDPSARGHHRSYAALSLSHSRPTSLGPTGFGCLLDDATETTFVAKPVRQAEKIREAEPGCQDESDAKKFQNCNIITCVPYTVTYIIDRNCTSSTAQAVAEVSKIGNL